MSRMRAINTFIMSTLLVLGANAAAQDATPRLLLRDGEHQCSIPLGGPLIYRTASRIVETRINGWGDCNPGQTTQTTVKVSIRGDGVGGVRSDPPGILCGQQCEAIFASGAQVILRAIALPGSLFAGFDGVSCSETQSRDHCRFIANGDTINVVARFVRRQDATECPSLTSELRRANQVAVAISPSGSDQLINAEAYHDLFRLPRGLGSVPVAWPGAPHQRSIRLGRGEFISAVFTVPADTPVFRWDLHVSQRMAGTRGAALVSISPCPGALRQQDVADRQCLVGFPGRQRLSVAIIDPDEQPNPRFCSLKRGETYYLNIGFFNPENRALGCPGRQCEVSLSSIFMER